VITSELNMNPIQALLLQAVVTASKPDSTIPVQTTHVYPPAHAKIVPKCQKRPSFTRSIKKRRGEFENRDTHL
jgi:hypothetical protein